MRLLIFFLFITITISHAQPGDLVEITKKWPRKDITVKDGLIYKYTLPTDSARYFNPGADAYDVTITFTKRGTTIPPVLTTEKVDGEKATFSTNWSIHGTTTASGWYGDPTPTIAYSNVAGSSVSYTFTGTKIELWAERKSTHGSGTVTIDNGQPEIVSFVSTTTSLPVLIYSSPNLTLGSHTIKLTVTSGYCLLDYFIVTKPSDSQGSVTPSGNIINILQGENLKNKIESAASGTTVRIADAVFNSPIINVPKGVNIECGPSTVITCSTPGTWPLDETESEIGLFNFKSASRVDGNQYIRGCILEGNNVAFAAAVVDNIDNVKFQGCKVRNFNFTGLWIRNANNAEVSSCNFDNTAWSSNSFLSGAVNIYNVTSLVISANTFQSTENNGGTGIEALWKESTLTNVKIIGNTFKLSKHNPWNNGSSRNFSIELHDTHYRGLEISNNVFGNEVSLASHKPGNGTKTVIYKNTGDLGGDTYFIEAVCDDLEVYDNYIRGSSMFSANFQPNSKWKNHNFRNNIFESSGVVSWGGVFLFGPTGVQNVLIENNTIKTAGNQLVKYMGITSGVTERNNNVTQ